MKNPVRDLPPSQIDIKTDYKGRRELQKLKKEVAIKEKWLIDSFPDDTPYSSCEDHLWKTLDETTDRMEELITTYEQLRVVCGGNWDMYETYMSIRSNQRSENYPSGHSSTQGLRLARTKK